MAMSKEGLTGPGEEDVVMEAPREELAEASGVQVPEAEPASREVIRPDSPIDWDFPCLSDMAAGPCGTQFRDAFSCFYFSEADPQGSDCAEVISALRDCMAEFQKNGHDDDKEEPPENRSVGTQMPPVPVYTPTAL